MQRFFSCWTWISLKARSFLFGAQLFALASAAFAASGQLVASPAAFNFSGVPVGTSQTQAVTLTNSGGTKITVTQAMVSATGFTLSGPSYPITLSGGQSTSISVTFAPQSAATFNGTVSVVYSTQGSGKGRNGQFGSTSTLSLPISGASVAPGQLTASPTSLIFGRVQLGNSQTLTETLTNSGGTGIIISAVSSTASFSPSGFSLPLALNAGQSVSFSVTFSPTSAGTISGGMTITSNGSNPSLTVPLSGTCSTPGQVTASPANLSFGAVPVGSSAFLPLTVTNSGGSGLTISQIMASGSGFTLGGINLPITLAAAQSYTFNVSFSPQVGGSFAGSLTISSNGSNPTVSVPLSGTGAVAGQLTILPASANFGSVTVGSTQSQTGVLSAGNSAITVSSVGVSGSQFSVTGIALPITINAGNSVSFQVAFTPQSAGTASANVTFNSNASNSPTVMSLSGSGTSPQHSVSLSWSASTSTNVVGYNVYTGTTSGGPYTRINSVLTSSPSYTDNSVQGGHTYYYVTTAVDSLGVESTYSNQVQAVVPYP